MIVGIGSDLANIERIEKSIDKFGSRFINRIFSEVEKLELERREAISQREYVASIARRFAAKEACSKALGTGFKQGTFWKDLEIKHLPSGKPTMIIYGEARNTLLKLCDGKEPNILVTMTDDYPWAQAFVIMEVI